MITVNKLFAAITDYKVVMKMAREILREIDPEYTDEEARFHAGVQAFRFSLTPEEQATLDELLILEEKRMTANFLFLIWRGINQNLRCFHDHKEKGFLNQDYEDVHDESVMEGMPANEEYWRLCSDFHHSITSEQNELFAPISSYYCYLATSAYKIAHYFGFKLADNLFYCYIDDFYSGNSDDIKRNALFTELYRYLDDALKLNVNDMLDAALKATRIDMTPAAKRQFFDKYITGAT